MNTCTPRARVGVLAIGTVAALGAASPATAAPVTGPRPAAQASTAKTPVPVRAVVTAAPTARIATLRARVVTRGTVTAARTTRTVQLQRLVGRSAWRVVATTRTVRGSYAFRLPTTAPGRHHFRVVAVPAAAEPSSTSAPFVLAVGRGSASSVAYLTSPPSRWNPCSVINYRVNLSGAPAGAATDVRRAVAEVASATGLRFRAVGTTRVVPGSAGADVLDDYPAGTNLVIAYAKPGQSHYLKSGTNVLAMGGAFYRPQVAVTGGQRWHEIVQSYLVVDRTKKLPAGFGSGNRYGLLGTWGQVLMHELGHTVGLDHPAGAPSQIMYANTTTKPAVWGAGDLAGLRRVGAASGCFAKTATKAAGGGITAATRVGHDH